MGVGKTVQAIALASCFQVGCQLTEAWSAAVDLLVACLVYLLPTTS